MMATWPAGQGIEASMHSRARATMLKELNAGSRNCVFQALPRRTTRARVRLSALVPEVMRVTWHCGSLASQQPATRFGIHSPAAFLRYIATTTST